MLDRYRELRIPLDGIVQDWQYWGCDSNWNAMCFMNPYNINKRGADACFTLYEDEGDGYNYEKGQFTQIPFRWNETTRTLTIGSRAGRFKGMLNNRIFRIVLVTPQSPAGTRPMPATKTVQYSGERQEIVL